MTATSTRLDLGKMTHALGASDAEGAWIWKDVYEVAEATVVLFVKRYGLAMRRRGGGRPPAHARDARRARRVGALAHEGMPGTSISARGMAHLVRSQIVSELYSPAATPSG